MSLPSQIPDQSWPAAHASGWNVVYETFLGTVRGAINAIIGALKPVATSGAYTDLTGLPTLGTVASHAVGEFATAAQGTKADNALQSGALTGLASINQAPPVLYASSATTVPARATVVPTGYSGPVIVDISAYPRSSGLDSAALAVMVNGDKICRRKA